MGTIRRSILLLAPAALALLIAPAVVEAHNLSHDTIRVGVGESVVLGVEDGGNCSAQIRVQPGDPAIASVSPSDTNAIKGYFRVTGMKAGTTELIVNWRGVNFPDGPCNEDGGAEVHVIVRDCSRERPVLSPGSDIYLAGGTTARITFSTGSDCSFRVRGHRATGRQDGWAIAPGGWQPVARGAAAEFVVTVDPAKVGRSVMARFEWISNDDGHGGSDYVTIHAGSPPPALPAAQSTTGGTPGAGSATDPVNTATGELYMPPRADLSSGGPLRLHFSRYYASMMTHDGAQTGDLGPGWSHNFGWRLFRSANSATVLSDRGRFFVFQKNGSAWSVVGPTETPFQLVASGDSLLFADPRLQMIYVFDTVGRLRAISDGRGNRLALRYRSDGLLDHVDDGLGRRLNFGHDTLHRITSVGDGSRTVRFEYDGDLLAGFVDARGNRTRYSYDRQNVWRGLLTSWTTPEGHTPYVQSYDADGRVATQTEAPGNRYTFAYDDTTTTIRDPIGEALRHRHDTRRQLLSVTDQTGSTMRLVYNTQGVREAVIDRLGDTTGYGYDAASGLISSIRNADGSETRYSYTTRTLSNGLRFHDRTSVRHADGTTSTYVYDVSGNVTEMTDRAGNRWRYGYNGRGQVSTVIDAAGGTTTRTYGADGTLLSERDNAGNTTTRSYDQLRRLSRITYADNTTRSFEYDAGDNLAGSTDERGGVHRFTYDRDMRLISYHDPLGRIWGRTHDPVGRLTSLRDPLGGITRLGYDSLGRLASITDATGRTRRLEYDPAGRPLALIDAGGYRWTRTVDAEGVITGRRDPLGNRSSIVSDRMGRAKEITSPLGNRTRFAHDAMGRLTELRDPLDGIRSYTYDGRGLMIGADFPESITAEYLRDSLGLIRAITDPLGNLWQSARDPVGRLLSTADPLGNTTSIAHDSRNRIRRITLPGGMGRLDITHDASGAVTRLSGSDSTELRFSYDAAGRITAATGMTIARDAAGRIGNVNGIVVDRDSSGRVVAMMLAPGKQVRYGYDSRGLLSSVHDWVGGSTSFSHDSAGRRVGIGRPNGITTSYRYDADGRLVSIGEGGRATITLERDAAGRITAATRTGMLRPAITPAARGAGYDAASQLSGGGYAHDAMGRMTASPERSYRWDLFSRLKSYTEGARTVSFTYDGFGNRLSRTEGSTTRRYVWNSALGLPSISIEREGVNDVRYHIHTPDGMLLHSIDAGANSRRFHHYNEVGSTVMLSDDAGAITDRYAYTPYGVMTAHDGTSDNPFTYVGGYGVMQEPGSDLYQMRARFYDAGDGRFLSRDPVRSLHPRKLNLYRYALGNPMGYIDPTGRDEIPEGALDGESETPAPGEAPDRQTPEQEEMMARWLLLAVLGMEGPEDDLLTPAELDRKYAPPVWYAPDQAPHDAPAPADRDPAPSDGTSGRPSAEKPADGASGSPDLPSGPDPVDDPVPVQEGGVRSDDTAPVSGREAPNDKPPTMPR